MVEQSDQVIALRPAELNASYNYPFAAAPDIIRAHQKDAYFQGVLLNHLSTITRRLYGARFLHTYTSEAKTISDLLYLALTTLIGNRTLGEEYCDIVQVEDDTLQLPAIARRAGYLISGILLPFSLAKVLPSFRAKLRGKLERNLSKLERQRKRKTRLYQIQAYLLRHIATITSPSPLHALTLITFYFSGAYYQLSKRIFGLRYIFTKRIGDSEARVGYEVLGVLLVLQVAVQSWLHIHSTIGASTELANTSSLQGGTAVIDGGVEVSLDPSSYSSNNELLFESHTHISSKDVAETTNTPVVAGHRYHLADAESMKWIKGQQQRRCTLCLEDMKDPSATQCGHIFCWTCIGDWIREKPECPLCRRAAMVQHILPLRF